jgi:AraC family transcriptional regulator
MDSVQLRHATPEGLRCLEMQALVSSVMTLLDAATWELDQNRDAAKATIGRAAALLRIEIEGQTPAPSPVAQTALLPWQSRRVREYIDGRIGTRLLICDLSATAKLSESHFARAFKSTFGQTPHAYLVRRRVELASRLMRDSENSLSDIALTCGFSDQAHLCRLFRRCIGQSPAAWRRARCEAHATGRNFASAP